MIDRKGSKNAPTARLLYPNGGEVFDTGVQKVLWTVDDADGDPVLSRIEYFERWRRHVGHAGETVGSAEPPEMEIDVKDLPPPSADARFRVIASDGFRTAIDASDCPRGRRRAGAGRLWDAAPPARSASTSGRDRGIAASIPTTSAGV